MDYSKIKFQVPSSPEEFYKNGTEDVPFQVPKTGYYEVVGKVYKSIPTGRYEMVPNPDRMWFQWWKPKEVSREIYEMVVENSGREIRFLSKGETVFFKVLRRL